MSEEQKVLSPLERKLLQVTKKKESLFQRVQHTYDCIAALSTGKNVDNFLARCLTLDKTVEEISGLVDQINELELQKNPKFVPNYALLTAVDELVCHIIAAKQKIVVDKDANPASVQHKEAHSVHSSLPQPRCNVVLPPLEIEPFCGKICDWPRFKTLFSSLIINDKFITDIQKSHYLHSFVKEPAARIIQAYRAACNFDLAWQALCNRFESDRVLANHYLHKIMEPSEVPSRSNLHVLQNFLVKVGDNVNSLKALGVPDLADFILFSLSIQQLDSQIRQDFELEVSECAFPSCEQLLAFVNKRCRSFELSVSDVRPTQKKPNVVMSGQRFSKQVVLSTKNQMSSAPSSKIFPNNSNVGTCPLLCTTQHALYRCPIFAKKSPRERNTYIKEVNGCFNCLSLFHHVTQCTSLISCSVCGQKHHSMLHFPKKGDTGSKIEKPRETTAATTSDLGGAHPASRVCFATPSGMISAECKPHPPLPQCQTVLLGTAVAQIKNVLGRFVQVRILVDCGSTTSFITKDLVRRLNLPVSACNQEFSGLNASSVGNSWGVVECTLKPRASNHPQLSTNAFVVNEIVDRTPSTSISISVKNTFKQYDLADPNFDRPGPVDFLLGSDLFCAIISPHQPSDKHVNTSVLSTVLGAIIMGPVPIISARKQGNISLTTYPTSRDSELDTLVHKFWESEEVSKEKPTNPEDIYCEEQFIKTHRRDVSGRFVVRLPFKVDPLQLDFPETRSLALQRFFSLENRMSKDSVLKKTCLDFLNEYKELGHMKAAESPGKCVIPYFCVFNPSSPTTKARIVFDASAFKKNIPLNKVLLTGPKLQKDISFIIIKFRTHRFVFTCDMEKMYRQILVDPSDRPFQHIYYRDDPSKPLEEMELQTVTYGLTPSAFLAQRVLIQLADVEAHKFPLGASILKEDVYIDDLLVGSDCVNNLIELKDQVCGILRCAGIALNKWSSNSNEFLHQLKLSSGNQPLVICNDSDSSVKVLGVMWNPTTDSFGFKIVSPPRSCTKRSVLSTVARFYDPLGFAAPVVFLLKCFLQTLWKEQVEWDVALPQIFTDTWNKILSEFPALVNVVIPRPLFGPTVQRCQVLGFCDASEKGYCAAVYVRVVSPSSVHCSLLTAKTKVAPLKTLTIPRLELLGALLLARLITQLKPSLAYLKPSSVFLFSDSSIVLHWLHKPLHVLQTFVSHRVGNILEHTDIASWYHIKTECNPADVGSRGLSPQELVDRPEWFTGPPWCCDSMELWPCSQILPPLQDDLPEVKRQERSLVTHNYDDNFTLSLCEKFSSLLSLQRSVAYIRRFATNCRTAKSDRVVGALTVQELKEAMKLCVRLVQQKYFSSEIAALDQGKMCSSRFQSLSVFIDNEQLLRVGGRLVHSSLGYEARHPYLLPKKSHFTNLLINFYHRTYLHAGPRTVRAIIQRNFWIINAHSAIRHCIFQCVRCKRFSAQTFNPVMGNLPTPRVVPSRVFSHVSVDFAGPFLLKESLRRNARTYKGYFAVFICLATKACHIEAVTSLSSEAFISTLQRFVSRRGLCSNIYCDQGTNFRGASRLLKEVHEFIRSSENQNAIVNAFTPQNIQFHFQVAHAPFMNGLSESHVKNVKFHLHRVIGNRILTLSEFITVLAKIEAILNSRPLYPLSASPDDFSALTPGHFLVGGPLCAVSEIDVTEVKENRLDRWQIQNQITQRFWKRWQDEYLHTLQQKNKWFQGDRNIATGQLVWIKEDHTTPLTYPLGRVKSIRLGSDGVARSAVVATPSGEYSRPVRKLVPLFSSD